MSNVTCCETMIQQLTNRCEQHGLDCPDNVVRKYKNGYGIPHPDDNSYYAINYCPWCGAKLPDDEIRRNYKKK